jgi:hypothetical protein
MLEQLGQRVLQQRQRARLLAHVLRDRRDQPRPEQQPGALGRAGDRPLQLVPRQRQHELDALAQQLAKVDILERSVGEIGPQRGDDTQHAVRVVHGGAQASQEVRADGLVLGEGK